MKNKVGIRIQLKTNNGGAEYATIEGDEKSADLSFHRVSRQPLSIGLERKEIEELAGCLSQYVDYLKRFDREF